MRIGVDLRALQVGHQYRGIGEVVKRTLNEMFPLAIKDDNSFVFYAYDNMPDPKVLLDIPGSLKYKEIPLGESPLNADRSTKKKLQDTLEYLYGNPIKTAKECDVFLQYDYALGIPLTTKTVLIKHDIIPYLFWNQHFESPLVPFKNKAARTTLRTAFHNYRYVHTLKRSMKNANKIITVSEHTRSDLHKHFGIPLSKMITIPHGVSEKLTKNTDVVDVAKKPTKPYLLFIGAVDKRRRVVDDLVAAFNNLKAEGHDIQLALVGENFQSPEGIPEGPVRTAVKTSSYKDDILTLGYIDDATKWYLFKNAIAFVFPSRYEGFGIPVLESMLMECPVVAYKNSAIPEVGGEHVLYANGWEDIKQAIGELVKGDEADRLERLKLAKAHAQQFTWRKTAQKLYETLIKT